MIESQNEFIPLEYKKPNIQGILDNISSFKEQMDKRRSVRHFSEEDIPYPIIEKIILTATSAPSGAHKQPWTYCAVSSPLIKQQIRAAAEKEEYENYHGRMSKEWLSDLQKFKTDWNKEFLTTAPWLIVLFKINYDLKDDGKHKNYYVQESVGISLGFLITAIHIAGLVTLTHTPSPMNFLQNILGRPENEKPFMLLPIGYPAKEVEVPKLQRKSSEDVIKIYQ